MKNLIHAIRSCRLFRPMTLEEAKLLCLTLSESMIREHEETLKEAQDYDGYRTAARHMVWMAEYTRRPRLNRASLLLHIRFLVGSKKERTNIIIGCLDASFELMLKPRQGEGPPPGTKSPPDH